MAILRRRIGSLDPEEFEEFEKQEAQRIQELKDEFLKKVEREKNGVPTHQTRLLALAQKHGVNVLSLSHAESEQPAQKREPKKESCHVCGCTKDRGADCKVCGA